MMGITKRISYNTELSTEQLVEGEHAGKYIAELYHFEDSAGAWCLVGDTYKDPKDTPEAAIEYGMEVFKRYVHPDIDDDGNLIHQDA